MPKDTSSEGRPTKRPRTRSLSARDQSPTTDVTSSIATINDNVNTTILLFQFSFLIPLLLTYFTDADALISWLPVCKVIKQYCIGYRNKIAMDYKAALSYASTSRWLYMSVTITKLLNVTSSSDLSWFPMLTSVVSKSHNAASLQKLPPSVTELHLADDFNAPITPGMLPVNLKTLKFGEKFDHPILPGSLPASLEELHFGCTYNQPLVANSLPSNLTSLVFNRYSDFNHPILPGVLPNSLTMLKLGSSFNQHFIPDALPLSIRKLDLNRLQFDQPLDSGFLPSQLIELTLGEQYHYPSQSIEPGVIPSSVRVLRQFSCNNPYLEPGLFPVGLHSLELCSSQPPLPGCFPDTLQSLVFSDDFDEVILPGVLPEGLKYLSLGKTLTYSLLKHMLPSSLTYLQLSSKFNKPLLPDTLPSNLTTLKFPDMISSVFNQALRPGLLPARLVRLDLGRTQFNHPLEIGTLPTTLRYLNLGGCYNQPLHSGVIPHGVVELDISGLYSHPLLPFTIPSSVHKLKIGGSVQFHDIVETGSIPSSVTFLTLCSKIRPSVIPRSVTRLTWDFNDAPQKGVLPDSLTHLKFGDCFDSQIISLIPSSVTHLSFGANFQCPIKQNDIPSSVQYLELRCLYFHRKAPIIVPSSVFHLFFGYRDQIWQSHDQPKLTFRPPRISYTDNWASL